MARLEEYASGRSCDPDTDPATIEHVLSENPPDDWAQHFPRERWEAAVYRLGNLTLPESAANHRVGNATFVEKLGAYSQSAYALTRKIPEIAPEQWTLDLLDARQHRLTERAVHLWRADLARSGDGVGLVACCDIHRRRHVDLRAEPP